MSNFQAGREVVRIRGKLRKWLTTAALIISIQGLVTFSLFIFEEALQITTFGTWPAQDAKSWDLALEGTDLLESINLGMKIINYTTGWIQPLAFFAYRAYGVSTDYYIRSVRAKIFAMNPESFDGREVDIDFIAQSARIENGSHFLINHNVWIPVDQPMPVGRYKIKGKVEIDGKKVIIKVKSIE